jgi:tetratricopeptide (TPR) repeat protein
VTCPNCGVPFVPESTHCDVCGASLPPHCRSCGIETPNNVEICIHCRTERAPILLDASSVAAMSFEVPRAVLPSGLDLRTAFVGRADILQEAEAQLGRCATQSELHFVTLTGPPGIGKSRLLRQLRDRLGGTNPAWPKPARILTGRAGGHGAPPYGALIRMLAQLFEIRDGMPPAEARDHILKGVAEAIPGTRSTEVSHLIGQLMRLPFPGSPIIEPLAASPAQLEMRMFIAARRLLAAYAERQPLVLFLDDMERASAETVNLLHYLAAGLSGSPVLAFVAGRPNMLELHPRWGEGEFGSTLITLPPLVAGEVADLLTALFSRCVERPEALIALIQERLDGVPRNLEELVRYLLEAGVIDAGAEHWKVDLERLETLDLPTTHVEIVERRLASMAPGDRTVLERCAACGEIFWVEAVVALIRAKAVEQGDPDGPSLEVIADSGERTHQSVLEALKRHVTRGFIIESEVSEIRGQKEFRFAYPPIWNLVYDHIDEVERCRYHRIIAQWLELRPEGRGMEVQEEVGRHLELAADRAPAAQSYRRAADLARLGHYNDKAIRLYTQALACVGDQDVGTRIQLWHDLGSICQLRGDYEKALAAFEKMLRLSWVMNSRAKGGVAFNKMGRIYRQKGDLNLAVQYLERGKALFDQSGDLRGIAGSLDDLGQVLWLQGRYEDALEKSSVALEQRRRIGDARSIAVSLTNIGNIEHDRGLINEATACHEEALALRRQVDDKAGIITSLNAIAVIEYLRGNLERAVPLWQEALGIAETIGATPMQAMLLNNLGEGAVALGELVKARQRLEESVGLARVLDERRVLADGLRNLALLEMQEGVLDKARTLALESRDVAKRSGMKEYEARALLALGQVHAKTLFDDSGASPADKAKEYYSSAVDMLRDLDNQGELAAALNQYGEFLVERGNADGGKLLLEEARLLFQKLGMKARDKVAQTLESLPRAET